MQKYHTIEEIVDYVIKWVEARYADDEYVSIALTTVNGCLRFRNSANNFLAYVMRSVYNACISHKSKPHNSLQFDPAYPAGNLDLKDTGLCPTQIQILQFRFEHNLEFIQIASELSLTYGQVRYLYWKALNQLRAEYERE